MNIKINRDMQKVLFILLTGGATLSLTYLIGIVLFKSALVLGFMLSLLYFVGYSFITSLIGMAYLFGERTGHPIPGLFTMLSKRLTQEQMNNLSKDYQGKRDMYIHEFLTMRMDILFPAGMLFIITLAATLPTLTTSAINTIVLSQTMGLFVISYLVYTFLQAYLFAIKLSGESHEMTLEEVDKITMLNVT
jgi:hypothetical protein